MKHFEAKEKHAHKLAQAHQHDMMQAYDAGKRAAEWFYRPAYDVKNIKKIVFWYNFSGWNGTDYKREP